MLKSEFFKAVAEGARRGRKYMVVKVETEDSRSPEIVINPAENIPEKLAYYNQAYNDDMEMIGKAGTPGEGKLIRITDVLMTGSFSDLNWFVY